MKIYILPVPESWQPAKQRFKYPAHNEDYGVEQDFLKYLVKNNKLLTKNPKEADWHYLPAFWTRYAINTHLDEHPDEVKKMKKQLDGIVKKGDKTFTICQHKDAPFFGMGDIKVFLGSRTSKKGLDVPLLSSPHKKPSRLPKKTYIASFIGQLDNHPVRKEMAKKLKHRKDVYLAHGNKGERFFVNNILESYISLCPRGFGGSSFRFYESLQLGTVPFMIGDIDTRPFKKYIDWDQVSFYSSSAAHLNKMLDKLKPKELIEMGRHGSNLWKEKLTYQKWCPFLLRELKELKK